MRHSRWHLMIVAAAAGLGLAGLSLGDTPTETTHIVEGCAGGGAGDTTEYLAVPVGVRSSTSPTATDGVVLDIEKFASALRLSFSGQVGPVDVVSSNARTWLLPSGLSLGLSASMLDIPLPAEEVLIEYYSVNDELTVSPAEQNFGYSPRPAPGAPDLPSEGRWWGQSFTVSVSNLDPIREANRGEFFWQSIPPDAPFHPSQPVTFTVPDDARGGWFFVQANNRRSQTARWLKIRPTFTDEAQTGVPVTFSDISSVSWVNCPGSGSDYLFIAEAQGIWRLSMMKTLPTALKVAGVNPGRYYLSRATSDNRILFVAGEQGHPAIRAIDACAASPAPVAWAATSDDQMTRQIRPRGIAVRPAGDHAYLADGLGGYTVRVPHNAGPGSSTITDRWGGNTVLAFPDPCGIDAAASGTLLVTSQSPMATYRVPAAGGSTVLQTNNSRVVHSLQIDRDVSTTSTLRNLATGDRGVAMIRNRATGMGGVVFALPDHLAIEGNFRYQFVVGAPERVLLSNLGPGTPGYPYTSGWQSADRLIRVEVRGWGSVPQYLRVVDPPDTAPYAAVPGSPVYYADDNTATQVDATDWGLTLDPAGVAPPPQRCLAVTPPSDSAPAVVYLKVPAHYSGDNFRIEVSKQDWGPTCEAPNTVEHVSPRFTSWKRIFIERDKMFRRGGLLAEDAAPGQMSVQVAKTWDGNSYEAKDGLSIGDLVVLFDTEKPFDQSFVAGSDIACVRGWDSIARGNGAELAYSVDLGTPNGTTCEAVSPITRAYAASHTRDDAKHWDFADPGGRSAGIGMIGKLTNPEYCDRFKNQKNRNSCYYDVDIATVQRLFDDAFVEVIAPPSGMSVVPFMGLDWLRYWAYEVDQPHRHKGIRRFNRLWFKHFIPKLGDDPPRAWEQNYFQFIAASDLTRPGHDVQGITDASFDYSMSFWHSIDRSCSGDEHLCLQHTSVHELVHQFNTNPCNTDYAYHCRRNAWCSASHCGKSEGEFQCAMYYLQPEEQRKNDVDRLCTEDLLLGDPTCPAPAPGEVRPGAVRTTVDPQ